MNPNILLNSTSTNDYFNIFEFYCRKFEDVYVDPVIFGEFTTILCSAFLIRLLMLIRIEKENGYNKNRKRRSVNLYLVGHIGFEILIAYVICYVIIKLTNANLENYIINMIIAPATGFMLSILFDLKVIMAIESNMNFGIPSVSMKAMKSNKKDSRDSSNTNNNITVNVNNGSTNIDDTKETILPYGNTTHKINFLDKSSVDDDDFNLKVVDSINEIIETQYHQSMVIDANTERLENIIGTVNTLRNTEMIDKKLEIKSAIYKCLNKGFATLEENENITLKYQSYRSLGGNHEIESLYEDHYLKLSIHEDRRIKSIPVEVDNRGTSQRFIYGEFDSDYIDE